MKTSSFALACCALLGVVLAEPPLPQGSQWSAPLPSGDITPPPPPVTAASSPAPASSGELLSAAAKSAPAVREVLVSAHNNHFAGYVSPSDLLVATPPQLPQLPLPLMEHSGYSYSNPYSQQEDFDVLKHVYVHVAPEDPVDVLPKAQVIVSSAKPKKHYKIVFIKTPLAAPPPPASVALPPRDEEKTLIYVLSRRPGLPELQQVRLSAPPPTTPSKPEVFFIRYKSEREQLHRDLSASAKQQDGDLVKHKVIKTSYGPPGHEPPPLATSYASQDSNRLR